MSANENARILKLGPGSMIAGRFEVVERLGAGGMGIVYKGIDHSLNNQIVALKILNPFLSQNEVVLKRFMNEVLVARSLSHPNIIRIHDIGNTEDGFAYISMEYVDGKSLSDVIMPQGEDSSSDGIALDFNDALSYLFQILNGVAYAHEKGVIHRDLKPANVMISKSGEVKLADFGTARVLGEQTGLTQDGQSVGTPDYMSPEQIRGEGADYRSDIYSLGIIAYQLVTGRKPFIADSPVAVAFKHINDPFPFFANEEIGIPKWFEAIIHKATAKRKEDRFASAEQFAFALAEQVPELSPYAKTSHVGLPTFHNIETQGSLGSSSTTKFTIGIRRSPTWVMNNSEQAGEEGIQAQKVSLQTRTLPWALILIGASLAICVGIIIFFLVRPISSAPVAAVEPTIQPQTSPTLTPDSRTALEKELLTRSSEIIKPSPTETPKEEISPTPVPPKIDESLDEAKPQESEVKVTTQPETQKPVEEPTPVPIVRPTATPRPKAERPVEDKKLKEPELASAAEDDLQSRFGKVNKITKDSVDAPDVINVKPQVPVKKKGEINLLGAHSEVYRGSIVVDGASKRMALELVVQGDRVTGLADVAGHETFEVSGGIYPRGVSFTLKNPTITLNLTGTKRGSLLRGTFTTAGSGKIGKWEVSMAN